VLHKAEWCVSVPHAFLTSVSQPEMTSCRPEVDRRSESVSGGDYSRGRRPARREVQTSSHGQRRPAGGCTGRGRSQAGPNLALGAAGELDRSTAPSAGHDSDSLS